MTRGDWRSMRLVLDGKTAFEFWMSVTRRPLAGRELEERGPAILSTFEDFTCADLEEAFLKNGGVEGAIEVIVADPCERRQGKALVCRSLGHGRTLPSRSVLPIGAGLYAVAPELCVIRLAVQLPRLEFLRAFTDLLGIFCLSKLDRTNLISREPILTLTDMREFLDKVKGFPGTKLVRKALDWVVERSASPRETTMNLLLRLPTRMGGYGLPSLEANYRFDLEGDAAYLTSKSYLVADVAWPEANLVLEYNSSKHHDNEEQKEFDFDKITAMQHMGKTVIPVSTRILNDYEAFSAVARDVRNKLGIRNRSTEAMEQRRKETHEELMELERKQRDAANLIDAARWKFLIPRLFSDEEA